MFTIVYWLLTMLGDRRKHKEKFPFHPQNLKFWKFLVIVFTKTCLTGTNICTKQRLPGTNVNTNWCLPWTNPSTKMRLPVTKWGLFRVDVFWCLGLFRVDTFWCWNFRGKKTLFGMKFIIFNIVLMFFVVT
jgi:hypothetical protein